MEFNQGHLMTLAQELCYYADSVGAGSIDAVLKDGDGKPFAAVFIVADPELTEKLIAEIAKYNAEDDEEVNNG